MNKVIVDLEKYEIKREVHEYLKEVCSFPSYYGCNLDALYDCLSDNNNFEFEIINSSKYHDYQIQLIDAIIDAGCKVTILPR